MSKIDLREGSSPSELSKRGTWEPPPLPPLPTHHEGRWWRHAAPGGEFVVIPTVATTSGRGHLLGGPGACYFSDSLEAVVAEVMRHLVDPGEIDPSLILRQFGSAQVVLEVMDLTDIRTLEALDISTRELVLDDWALPQSVVSYAAEIGFGGVVLPSAALQGARTLVVVEAGLQGIEVESTLIAGSNIIQLQRAFVSVEN